MKKFFLNPANLIPAGIIFALLLYFIFGSGGLIKRIKLEIEAKKLKNEIEKIEKENALLRRKIYELETNPEAIEKIAREKYGMAKEGEVVFNIKEK